MEYKYIKDRDFSFLSAGHVLLHGHNCTNFPVRLSSEIFMRCLNYSKSNNNKDKFTLYDPCCGSGYMLTTIGFLCGEHIESLIGSDIDIKKTALAADNLALLIPDNCMKRREKIISLYGENSKAIQSAKILAEISNHYNIKTKIFTHDIFKILPDINADIIITDIPYGIKCDWETEKNNSSSIDILNLFIPIIPERGIAAIVHDKNQKILKNSSFIRKEKQSVGKRIFEIFEKI